MSYTTSLEGSQTVFQVEPDPLPAPPPMMSKPLGIGLGIGFVISLALIFFVPLLAVAIAGYAFYKWVVAGRFKKAFRAAERLPYRRKYRFKAGPDGIEIDGKHIARDDITRVRILAFAGDDVTLTVTRFVDTDTVGGRVRERARLNILAYYKALAAFTYRVQVESKGKAHLIAGGIDNVCAYGVRTDVEKALGGPAN